MYKNLNKKAQELKIEKNENKDDIQKKEIQIQIETYQKEMDKIKDIFPDGFFEESF